MRCDVFEAKEFNLSSPLIIFRDKSVEATNPFRLARLDWVRELGSVYSVVFTTLSAATERKR